MPDEVRRFVSPEPEPNRRQRELLTVIIEECAEVQKRATKALRFGLAEIQPGQSQTNVARMSLEIGDLSAVVDLARTEGLVLQDVMMHGYRAKREKLARYLQTEPDNA